MKAVRAAGVMAILFAAAGASAQPPAKPAPAKSSPAKPAPSKSVPAKRAPPKRAAKSGAAKSGAAKTTASRSAAKEALQPPTEPATVSAAEPQKAQDVTTLRDLPYATAPGFRPMTLDLYQPKRSPQDYPKPLLIFVHGGGWSGGDARHGGSFDDFPAILAAIAAQQNDVVASVNYRLSGEAHFPAALQDVKSAIRWLRAHADEYGIDVTRVAIWGEEAGGHLAALAGTSCGVASLEPPKITNPGDKEPSDCVQAVIDWHGISDLTTLAADSGREAANSAATPEGAYLGCEPAACAPGFVKTTTPMTYMSANTPPFLIEHGAHDNVPLSQSQRLFEALTAAHIPVEQATHSDTDTDVAAKSIDRLEEFLSRTFPRQPTTTGPPARPKSGPLPY